MVHIRKEIGKNLSHILLAQTNRLLVQNWNVLSKMHVNGELEDISRLIEAEIVYFQSIQLVWDAASHCVNTEQERRRKGV